jgi:thioredoxin-dependent peroxiredoxin
MTHIRVGDQAPRFVASTHEGQTIALDDYRKKKVIVLFFYPKDGTLVCTQEACAFRDAYEHFVEAGAVVIGVSGDSLDAHRGFAQKYALPFVLLSDSDGAIRQAYDVPKTLGIFPGRVTYVIDKQGIIRHLFNSQFSASRHVEEAMAVVRRLSEPRA